MDDGGVSYLEQARMRLHDAVLLDNEKAREQAARDFAAAEGQAELEAKGERRWSGPGAFFQWLRAGGRGS